VAETARARGRVLWPCAAGAGTLKDYPPTRRSPGEWPLLKSASQAPCCRKQRAPEREPRTALPERKARRNRRAKTGPTAGGPHKEVVKRRHAERDRAKRKRATGPRASSGPHYGPPNTTRPGEGTGPHWPQSLPLAAGDPPAAAADPSESDDPWRAQSALQPADHIGPDSRGGMRARADPRRRRLPRTPGTGVNVTIGRVEVRQTARQEAPTSRPRLRGATADLSLDEYATCETEPACATRREVAMVTAGACADPREAMVAGPAGGVENAKVTAGPDMLARHGRRRSRVIYSSIRWAASQAWAGQALPTRRDRWQPAEHPEREGTCTYCSRSRV